MTIVKKPTTWHDSSSMGRIGRVTEGKKEEHEKKKKLKKEEALDEDKSPFCCSLY
jgi:hypothetical protein